MSEVEIEAVVDRVVYADEESGFAVLRLAPEPPEPPFVAVGPLAGLEPGENLRLKGRWVDDRVHGRQLKVEGWLPLLPASAEGIERYLGSGLVPGIAKGFAKKLVAQFGERTLEVIEREPDRLREVEGIGPKRRDRIVSGWAEQREVREVMLFLQTHGIGAGHAARIWRTYGRDAVRVLRANPYRLADDVAGIGFKSADEIAGQLGIPRDAPRRAEAGVLHALREAADEGHLFLSRRTLVERSQTLLGLDAAPIEGAIAALLADRRLVADQTGDPPFEGIWSRPLHHAETETAELLAKIAATPLVHAERGKRVIFGRALAEHQARAQIQLAPEQVEAVRLALEEKLLVITGGPGTGKTTLVRAILALLASEGRRIRLAAPTGRAARRLEEATGAPAVTIHRLLEWTPRIGRFSRDASLPLEADVVIVDEASMIDLLLFHHLVAAMPPAAQLILVGDVDQLPSVGPGRVLGDLIESGVVPVVALKHIFRQAEDSAIITNAHRVNRGELPVLDGSPGRDFYFLERRSPEEVLATIKLLVGTRIPRALQIDPVREIQVLTPMHRGLLGSAALNAELQAMLTPPGPELRRGSSSFRVGDKVIQLRNDYELDVSNGDIGQVVEVDPAERELVVSFDGRPIRYEHDALDALALAFACSIHKAQGSEFPAVVVPIHTQHFVMLRRNLLYTALTRGKRMVVLVGEPRALRIAVEARRVERRASSLGERLVRSRPKPAN